MPYGNMPVHKPLTELEKQEISKYLEWGLPVPVRYHKHLIPHSAQVKTPQSKTALIKLAQYGSSSALGTLIAGDNLSVIQSLAQKKEISPLQLIYIDPPFDVGSDFVYETKLRSGKKVSQVAYSDSWGGGEHSFLHMLGPRLKAMTELLSETGSIIVHCDYRTSPSIRLMLDRFLGAGHFRNEIIWHYTGGGRAKKYFSRKHDTLLWYSKSDRYTFNLDAVRVPYKKTSGYARFGIVSKAGKRYKPHPQGTPVDDVWDIPIINPMAHERVGYPTQKPLALINRLIQALTNEGDCVADFFCGSGTTLLAADRLNRKWLGVDRSPLAIASSLERLQSEASFCLSEELTEDRSFISRSESSAEVMASLSRSNTDTVLHIEGLRMRELVGFQPAHFKLDNGLLHQQDGVALMDNGLDWIRSWSLHDGSQACVDSSSDPQVRHILPALDAGDYQLRLVDINGGHHMCVLELRDV